MSPWQDLLARAEQEHALALAGRWEELAAAGAERARASAALPTPTRAQRPLLERLAEIQEQVTALLTTARADTARELGALDRGRSAVRGYGAGTTPGGWVDESS